MGLLRSTALVGSLFVYQAACLRPTETITLTVPWTGPSATSTTIVPCTGTATVLVQTPVATPSCTPTPTVRPTPCETLPDCPADGLDIDYYENPVRYYGTGDIPSSYYISEGLSPLDSSLTNTTYFPQTAGRPGVGETRDVNGGLTVNANNFTLVYSGFYRAPTTGLFTICSSSDNENDLFFGRGAAFSCDTGEPWADAQPLHISTGGFLMNPINCTDIYLVQDRYYPIRSVLGNYNGPSGFNLTIWEPNVPWEARKHDFDGNVYPASCAWF
ncbi:hypothetical protein F5X97DRAFT_312521 [Nemania serpens]|nr:hypothetical protein F5X97DRAFT_312521 [Nemania serpens]